MKINRRTENNVIGGYSLLYSFVNRIVSNGAFRAIIVAIITRNAAPQPSPADLYKFGLHIVFVQFSQNNLNHLFRIPAPAETTIKKQQPSS